MCEWESSIIKANEAYYFSTKFSPLHDIHLCCQWRTKTESMYVYMVSAGRPVYRCLISLSPTNHHITSVSSHSQLVDFYSPTTKHSAHIYSNATTFWQTRSSAGKRKKNEMRNKKRKHSSSILLATNSLTQNIYVERITSCVRVSVYFYVRNWWFRIECACKVKLTLKLCNMKRYHITYTGFTKS